MTKREVKPFDYDGLGGPDTVLFNFSLDGGPDDPPVVHQRNAECLHDCPHRMTTCGMFDWSARSGRRTGRTP